jgi:hypothetical protein
MSGVLFGVKELFNVRRTLTPDELKNLAAFPLTMIPGKPDHLAYVYSSFVRFRPGTVPYVVGTGNLILNYRQSSIVDYPGDPTGVIDSLLAESGNIFGGFPLIQPGDDISLLYGKDIILKNGGDEFTDGDGELTMDVQYLLIEPLP